MSDSRTNPALLLLLMIASNPGHCATTANSEMESNVTTVALAAEMTTIRKRRILFSHHSVGANVITGIKRLDAEASSGDRLQFASLKEAISSSAPALIDVSGGRNGDPKSKIDYFAGIIRSDARLKPDLAFMKLCYVDFSPHTDVDDLFKYYSSTIEALKREHPEIRYAHVTVPLTARPPQLKWRIYRLIGKEVWEDVANVKRTEFNQRLKDYFGADPVFDLALVEARAPDGSLTAFEYAGHSYPSLSPHLTDDGGHLNTMGQRLAGAAAIRFMAEGLKGLGSVR